MDPPYSGRLSVSVASTRMIKTRRVGFTVVIRVPAIMAYLLLDTTTSTIMARTRPIGRKLAIVLSCWACHIRQLSLSRYMDALAEQIPFCDFAFGSHIQLTNYCIVSYVAVPRTFKSMDTKYYFADNYDKQMNLEDFVHNLYAHKIRR